MVFESTATLAHQKLALNVLRLCKGHCNLWSFKLLRYLGTLVRVVAFYTRNPRFEPHHYQILCIYHPIAYRDGKKRKQPRNGLFEKLLENL